MCVCVRVSFVYITTNVTAAEVQERVLNHATAATPRLQMHDTLVSLSPKLDTNS